MERAFADSARAAGALDAYLAELAADVKLLRAGTVDRARLLRARLEAR
jgi:hypothetical protein